jgi:hypothetical protein
VVRDDDEAWRSIVDNYGDRPDLDDLPGAPDETAGAAAEPRPGDRDGDVGWGAEAVVEPAPDEDRYVPPPPPPLPTTTTDRKAAWAGLFGAPAVLLVCLVLGIRLPEIISYALVAGFVGGFLYLVVKMNREPRDPDDNGAVL